MRRNWSGTIIHAAIVPFLSDWQHGFRPDPVLPNSSLSYYQLAKAWDEGPQIDVVFLDLTKELEQVVSQNILLQNPCNFSISGSSLSWCADYVSNIVSSR